MATFVGLEGRDPHRGAGVDFERKIVHKNLSSNVLAASIQRDGRGGEVAGGHCPEFNSISVPAGIVLSGGTGSRGMIFGSIQTL